MALTTGTRLGCYEILGALGAGGMGEVYRARDSRLGRDVALKVLPESLAADPERMARFEREARVLASLNHSNIASIYGFEDSAGVHALVMELVEGQTLAERIGGGAGPGPASAGLKAGATGSGRGAGVPIEEALPIAKQICEGLEYAHERGIIHRDLKPANIKITPQGVAKILDFGLGKALEGDAAATDSSTSPTISHLATQAGIILGTAAYMAPEQAKGKAVDRRADIWAFGCVLYEMLAGKPAFGGETVTDVLAAVVRAEPDWALVPANTPAGIRYLLERCLKKEAKQRLQAIGDARIAIDEALVQAPAAGAGMKRAPTRFPWRRAAPWAVAAALAALAIAVGAAYLGQTPRAPQVLRFTIDPPENSEFGTSLALSPDGTRLVFVAAAEGRQTLWLRPLDSVQAEPMAGTEGAEFPFWSPDGQSIGFFANGKLKRLDLASGAAQSLCSVGTARGGSWSAEGVIVFAPDVNKPLIRIAAAGGTASAATAFDATRQDQSHRWPFFLPDGRHFLFLEERGGAQADAFEVGSLDSAKVETVVTIPFDSSVAYAAGYLLYSRSGSLVAQPFDAGRLAITGDPTPVAANVSPVGIVGPTGYTAVSVTSTGLLAYRNRITHVSQLTVADRSGKALSTIGPARGYSEPGLSPDKKKIVVAMPDPANPGVNALWIIDVTGGSATRLTFDKSDDNSPIWSPDGEWIYFSSNATSAYNMYRKRADGSGAQESLRSSLDREFPNSISTDGRYLVFTDSSAETGDDLWYTPLETGTQPKPLVKTPAAEENGVFSPDGKWVAFQSDENGPSQYEVFVVPFPPNGSKWQVSANGGYWPVWSDDGRELYFISGATLMAARVTAGATFQFQPPQPLFAIRPPEDDLHANEDYSIFPGGQKFLLNEPVSSNEKLPISVVTNWAEGLKRR